MVWCVWWVLLCKGRVCGVGRVVGGWLLMVVVVVVVVVCRRLVVVSNGMQACFVSVVRRLMSRDFLVLEQQPWPASRDCSR